MELRRLPEAKRAALQDEMQILLAGAQCSDPLTQWKCVMWVKTI